MRKASAVSTFQCPSRACVVSSSRCAPLARVRIERAARASNPAFGRLSMTFLRVLIVVVVVVVVCARGCERERECLAFFGGKNHFV